MSGERLPTTMDLGDGDTFLGRVNKALESGWQAKINQDGRLYYLNHNNATSHWIPPHPSWPLTGELPYGWEKAVDKNGKEYYLNHRTCTTTQDDPFDVDDLPPVQRDVKLTRDAALGFGFIAGSEKPVVVRSVTEGGPSVGKLLPGDEILKVNGEDVKNSDRQYIIDKIRYSKDEIDLTVIQPYIDKTGLKSSFLSATKKQKLKAKPPRVRFAENVNTFPSNLPKTPPSLVYLPNVLKVYLENGQTKSFKYDNNTTVKDVLLNLQEKLGLKCLEYFSLVTEDVRTPSHHKFIILQEHESLRQIADRPGSQNWKCLLRITFVPSDAYDLLNEDINAFDYFYHQCCNDVINERFTSELKLDMAVRLAALHIHQHVIASKQTAKVSVKAIEKEDGLERFLPNNVLSNWKAKELRKMITQYMKQNQNLTAPGQKQLTELQAKLHYFKIIGEMKSFGTRTFVTTLLDFPDVNQQSDASVIIGPKCDISLASSGKTGNTTSLLDFSQLTRILLTVESGTEDGVHRLELHQKSGQPVVLLMPTEEAQQMATFVNGYYKLMVNRKRSLLTDISSWSITKTKEAPPYYGKHRVLAASWNYPDDLASEVIPEEPEVESKESPSLKRKRKMREGERLLDLSEGPPPYEADYAYIERLQATDQFKPQPAPISPSDNRVNGEVHIPSAGSPPHITIDASPDSLPISPSDSSLPSPEKADSEKDEMSSPSIEDGDSTFSSNASSPASEVGVVNTTFASVVDFPKKKDTGHSRKRDKSLTEGISKKIFRSITGMKFNVTDTIASNDSNTSSSGEVKLLKFSTVSDRAELDSPSPSREDGDDENTSASSPSDAESGESRPGSRLRARDSILIQQKKMSPRLQRRRDSDESDDSLTDMDMSCKTPDSDVIDLTLVGDFDAGFDSDQSPSKTLEAMVGRVEEDVNLEDDVFISEEVGDASGDKREIQSPEWDSELSSDADFDTKLSIQQSDINISIGAASASLDDAAGIQEGMSVREILSDERDLVEDNEANDDDDDDEIPVSMIDLPSPEPLSRTPEDLSDEAHGMQLAALVALNASLEEAEEPLQGAAKRRDPECESDSGNETISSEIDNGNTDHLGISHSPSDFFRLGKASPSSSPRPIPLDRESNTTPTSFSGDEAHEQLGGATGGGATSSDTESTSTLRGSSPNLSLLDGADDKHSPALPQNVSDVLMASPEIDTKEGKSDETVSEMDDIEKLIAALVVPPPPPMNEAEIDEELLQAIIPPPAFEGFDEGTIDDIIIPPTSDDEGDQEEVTDNMSYMTSEQAKVEDKEEDIPEKARDDNDEKKFGIDNQAADVSLTHSTENKTSEILDSESAVHIEEDEREINIHQSLSLDDKSNVVEDEVVYGDDEDDERDDDSDVSFDDDSGLKELLALTMTTKNTDTLHNQSEEGEGLQENELTLNISDQTVEGEFEFLKELEHSDEDVLSNDIQTEELGNLSIESETPVIVPTNEDHHGDSLIKDNEDENLDVEFNYDSYGRMRGQMSPEQKVADILDAIIGGSSLPNPSDPSEVIKPKTSPSDPSLKAGIKQSKLQGSIDSGFHQPDHDQLSLTSPSETASVGSMESTSSGVDAKKDDLNIDTVIKEEDSKVLQVSDDALKQGAVSAAVRPKVLGVKPVVPPKPARPKDLQLKISMANEQKPETGIHKSPKKYRAPQPPQVPPRKRYTAPGIAEKASKFEGEGKQEHSEINQITNGYSTLPKSFSSSLKREVNCEDTAVVMHESDTKRPTSLNPQRPFVRADTVDAIPAKTMSDQDNLQSGEGVKRRGKPLTRSHTFSETSQNKDSDRLYPSRRAPPPPMPKPKLTHLTVPTPEKTPKSKSSSHETDSPSHGSASKKNSFKGSLSKFLTPSKNRTWGQLRDSLPFKHGSLKKGSVGNSRSKAKTRKPLKALWPSATCDSAADLDPEKDDNSPAGNYSAQAGRMLQKSESLDYEPERGLDVFVRVRSASMHTVRNNSEDNTSESDFDTPQNSPRLRQGGSWRKGRPSSMISLTDSYPPGFPKRPPPPRPSHPPVSKAASLSKLSTQLFISSPVKSSPVSPPPCPSPMNGIGYNNNGSPSPPPLPSTAPPMSTIGKPNHSPPAYDSSSDTDECTNASANQIMAIESKDYSGDSAVTTAMKDIEILVSDMDESIANVINMANVRQFRLAKENLLSEVREFTSNTKMVVSSSGQAGHQLMESTNSSMHTLARLCSATQGTMTVMSSTTQAQNLGKKVKDVASNFSATLQAANEAHGKPLNDPKMQLLLRQAQTMAALLSALMRSLRMLQH